MSFRDVSAPVRELAANGFALSAGLRQQYKYGLVDLREKFLARWPGSAALYLKNGKVPEAGALVMVSWPKPEGGTGFPARVVAILP